MTLAFRSVLQRAGLDVDYDTLNAVLGIAFLVCASNRQRSCRAWTVGRRDALLSRQSRLFGVRLRDLHPPEAAVGLAETSEFTLHFQDSYVPLIRRALDAGQSVLAWQGWPQPFENAWGLVTRTGNGRFGLAGTVGGSRQETDLANAPIQCYVVEQVEPRNPGAQLLGAAAIKAAGSLLNGRAPGPIEWVMGPAAYDLWIELLRDDAAEPGWANAAAAGHIRLAGSIAENRRSAVRFFGSICAAGVIDVGPLVRCCERVAGLLDEIASAIAESKDPLAALVDRLRQAQAADAELGEAAQRCLRQISAIR